MASQIGMAIRTEKAHERIDQYLKALTSAVGLPEPERPRDRLLRDTLRIESVADTLEALAAAKATGATDAVQAA